jgi:hypothetical protein
MAALSHAILAKRLPATIRRVAWEKGWNEDDHETDETVQRDQRGIWVIYKGTPDWGMTGSWSFAIQTFFHWATLDSSELSRISMAKLTRLNN